MTTETAQWLDAMADSMFEFAAQMMGMESGSRDFELTELPRGLGSYIAMVGDASSMQLGVIGDKDTCVRLSKALLMMEAADELEDSDMADAMNEVINVVAGGVKMRLNDQENGLTLGLPMFIEGQVRATPAFEWAGQRLKVGSEIVDIVILRQPK